MQQNGAKKTLSYVAGVARHRAVSMAVTSNERPGFVDRVDLKTKQHGVPKGGHW